MNEIDIKNHETVLQADELSRSLYQCSMLGRKLLAFGASRIQEKEISRMPFWSTEMTYRTYVPAAEFKISDFRKIMKMNDSGETYLIIKQTVKNLLSARIEIKDDDNEYHAYNWLSSVRCNKSKDRIELTFSHEIGWTLYNLKNNYTALNLKTIGEFKSFYAFRFYEIALSWIGMKGRNGNKKGCWFFQMTPEEIRRTFKIADEAYKSRMNNFVAYVISKPLEELNRVNKDFKVEVSKVMRGRNLVAFRFDCTETVKEAQKLKIAKTDGKKECSEKREINNEIEIVSKLKAKYPERWQEVFDFEMSQPCLFGGEEVKKTFAANKADLTLLQEFSDD